METYYLAWIMSIVLTFCMDTKFMLIVVKDLADRGYKFNMEKLMEIPDTIHPGTAKYVRSYNFLIPLMPIINILYTFKIALDYYNNKELIIQQFGALGALDIMEDLETEEYEKRPTGLNALLVENKVQKRLENANVIQFGSEASDGEVVFEILDDDNINILKVTAGARRYSNEELKEIILETLNTIYEHAINFYGDEESYIEALHNGEQFSFENTLESLEKTTLGKSFEEEKEELLNLKEELIQETTEEANENDKGYSYIKKR